MTCCSLTSGVHPFPPAYFAQRKRLAAARNLFRDFYDSRQKKLERMPTCRIIRGDQLHDHFRLMRRAAYARTTRSLFGRASRRFPPTLSVTCSIFDPSFALDLRSRAILFLGLSLEEETCGRYLVRGRETRAQRFLGQEITTAPKLAPLLARGAAR